jgi:nicotinamide-nucleotide amidase
MKVEIITIGDELLIGQTIDTNSAWMGRNLSILGFELSRRIAIGDNADAIKAAIDESFSRVDMVLLTGGLGPTKDDITKKTLCEYYQCGLRRDNSVMIHLETIFKSRGRQLLEINKVQADVPEICQTLPNGVGTAPGMWFDVNGKVLVSMPGVPNEMMHICTEHVFPRMSNRFATENILHKTLLTINIAESLLSHTLEKFESELPSHFSLAYLPALNTVKLRLTAKGSDLLSLQGEMEALFQKLCVECGEYLFAPEDVLPASHIATKLIQQKIRFTLAESCTAGYIANQLAMMPGISAVYSGSIITYSNEVKHNELGVPKEIFTTVGAVSEQCARFMVEGVLEKFNADIAISTTGIAGPTGATEEKPVGLIYIGVASKKNTLVRKFRLHGNREQFMQRASNCAMQMINEVINTDF